MGEIVRLWTLVFLASLYEEEKRSGRYGTRTASISVAPENIPDASDAYFLSKVTRTWLNFDFFGFASFSSNGVIATED